MNIEEQINNMQANSPLNAATLMTSIEYEKLLALQRIAAALEAIAAKPGPGGEAKHEMPRREVK